MDKQTIETGEISQVRPIDFQELMEDLAYAPEGSHWAGMSPGERMARRLETHPDFMGRNGTEPMFGPNQEYSPRALARMLRETDPVIKPTYGEIKVGPGHYRLGLTGEETEYRNNYLANPEKRLAIFQALGHVIKGPLRDRIQETVNLLEKSYQPRIRTNKNPELLKQNWRMVLPAFGDLVRAVPALVPLLLNNVPLLGRLVEKKLPEVLKAQQPSLVVFEAPQILSGGSSGQEKAVLSQDLAGAPAKEQLDGLPFAQEGNEGSALFCLGVEGQADLTNCQSDIAFYQLESNKGGEPILLIPTLQLNPDSGRENLHLTFLERDGNGWKVLASEFAINTGETNRGGTLAQVNRSSFLLPQGINDQVFDSKDKMGVRERTIANPLIELWQENGVFRASLLAATNVTYEGSLLSSADLLGAIGGGGSFEDGLDLPNGFKLYIYTDIASYPSGYTQDQLGGIWVNDLNRFVPFLSGNDNQPDLKWDGTSWIEASAQNPEPEPEPIVEPTLSPQEKAIQVSIEIGYAGRDIGIPEIRASIGGEVLYDGEGHMLGYHNGDEWVSTEGWAEEIGTNLYFGGKGWEDAIYYSDSVEGYKLMGMMDGKLIEDPFEITDQNGVILAKNILSHRIFYPDINGNLRFVIVPIIGEIPDGEWIIFNRNIDKWEGEPTDSWFQDKSTTEDDAFIAIKIWYETHYSHQYKLTGIEFSPLLSQIASQDGVAGDNTDTANVYSRRWRQFVDQWYPGREDELAEMMSSGTPPSQRIVIPIGSSQLFEMRFADLP